MTTVLVVDDEPDIRFILEVNLLSAGYEVVTAANGEEALAAIDRAVPDAVLLDVMMPGTDGWQVLQALKSSPDRARLEIPVFLVTALSGDEHRLRGGVEGALRYITKPFDPTELAQALAQVLEPDGPGEPELRRRVQAATLEALARSERVAQAAATGWVSPRARVDRVRGDEARGEPPQARAEDVPRVRLTRLEHIPTAALPAPRVRRARDRLGELTLKQRTLLDRLGTGASVTEVAEELGMSRSNVYAALRRVGRRLGLAGTQELLGALRQGGLLEGSRG